jgi:eukaryotic-like serine/threonine-protein kinase
MADSTPDLKSIFGKALELGSPAERQAYLEQACAGDARLRTEVESLLQAQAPAEGFFEAFRPAPAVSIDAPISECAGTFIGPYKLLEQIGEGGFGVVFMAEQQQPVRRRVALKVVKPGMDTRQVVARFEAERQALALMEHPNIAHVFDGGETASGRPYFVMELVRGIPITEFCDQNHLPVRERLQLFVNVCQAVQHAHQKGIIHRDLKPTNVMVTLQDSVPLVKVIDFGIAKATGQQLTEKTLFTNFAQMIGTPMYMSPEQAQMSAVDVDTRSDIYALGVLLYELLTGTTPFDKERLRTAAYDEIRRIIREEEPAKPSTRLSTLGHAAATVSANRRSDPQRLSQICRGELDWIVMKALDKDRNRRYETANGFAMDVHRYLADEAVLACPPSVGYRLRKFVRRNKGPVLGIAFVLLVLFGGIVGTTWQAVRATRAETEARTNEAKALAAAEAEEKARRDALDKLRDSYLAQAQARRWSGQAGRHFLSLDVLRKAAEIRPGLDLSNEALACMPLVDLRVVRKWPAGAGAFDADLKRYARAEIDGSISIHRVADDTKLTTLPAVDGQISGLLFSPDGKYLAAGYRAMVQRVWDLEFAKVVVKVELGVGATRWGGQAFSPDNCRYAVNAGDGLIRIHHLPSGERLQRFEMGSLAAWLAFHPKEPKLAVYAWGDPSIQILDANSGRVLTKWEHVSVIHGLAWHPDGHYLAAACADRMVRIWDTRTQKLHRTLEGHTSDVHGCAFNHAGDLLASCGWDVTTRLWDPLSGKQLVSMPGYHFHFSRDDRRLAYHFYDVGREVGICEIATGRECRTLYADAGQGRGPCSVHIHPCGRLLATAGDDGVRLWDLASHKELLRLPIGMARTALFDPDGKSLITYGLLGIQRWPMVVEQEGSRLRIGPPQTISPPLSVHPTQIRARLSRDGRWLAAVAPEGAVVFDLNQPPSAMKEPLRFDGHPGVWGVAISPDGRWVVTVAQHGKDIKVWDTRGLEPVRTLPAANYGMASFSPDGKRLVTSSIGHEPQQWDVESWTPRPFGKAYGGLLYMTSTSDGKMLALAYDGAREPRQLALVDATTHEVVATLTAPNRLPVSDLCFSPDGSWLAVSCTDQHAVQLWDLRALRRGLTDLKLAGDWPAYPPSSQPENLPPLQVEIVGGGEW